MTKREFAERVAEKVGAEVMEVEKANGVIATGICRKSEGGCPVVYIDSYYKDDDFYGAVIDVDKAIKEFKNVTFDFPLLSNYSTAKRYLKPRLYNEKTRYDVAKSAAEYGFDDLIIVPYMEDVIPNGSCRVTQAILTAWGKTADEVIADAFANVSEDDYYIRMMWGVMPVITNKELKFGAVGAIVLREKLREMFPDGYCLIPSSVHEMIVVPVDDMSDEYMSAMISEVNDGYINPEEVLGTKAYRF